MFTKSCNHEAARSQFRIAINCLDLLKISPNFPRKNLRNQHFNILVAAFGCARSLSHSRPRFSTATAAKRRCRRLGARWSASHPTPGPVRVGVNRQRAERNPREVPEKPCCSSRTSPGLDLRTEKYVFFFVVEGAVLEKVLDS